MYLQDGRTRTNIHGSFHNAYQVEDHNTQRAQEFLVGIMDGPCLAMKKQQSRKIKMPSTVMNSCIYCN